MPEADSERVDTPSESASPIQEEGEVNKVSEVTVETPVEVTEKVRPRRERKVVPGSNGPVRVVKVTRLDDPDAGVFQFRYPRADKLWDRSRLRSELDEHGLVLVEDPHYCELKDCWAPATDGAFCGIAHKRLALTAHDRLLAL